MSSLENGFSPFLSQDIYLDLTVYDFVVNKNYHYNYELFVIRTKTFTLDSG